MSYDTFMAGTLQMVASGVDQAIRESREKESLRLAREEEDGMEAQRIAEDAKQQ